MLFSGTPTEAVDTENNITVTVQDKIGAVAAQSFTLTINPAIELTPDTLPKGQVGQGYSQTISADGGTNTTVGYQIVSGKLAAGLTITRQGDTLTIAGMPAAAGSAVLQVTAKDQVGATLVQSYVLTASTRSPRRNSQTRRQWAGSAGRPSSARVIGFPIPEKAVSDERLLGRPIKADSSVRRCVARKASDFYNLNFTPRRALLRSFVASGAWVARSEVLRRAWDRINGALHALRSTSGRATPNRGFLNHAIRRSRGLPKPVAG